MHRLVLFLALGFVEQTASAEPVKVLQNARALRDFLVAGRQAATIEPVVAERGCGPINCSIDLDGVSILRNRGVVLDAATRKPLKIRQQTAGKLPTLDWQPLRGFSVSHVGRRWGTCLEFTHAGLGKSGRLQYWNSVLLIPRSDSRTARLAYRFVGYWAGCSMLTEAANPDEVSFPTVEYKGKALHILWHTCTALACTERQDPRKIGEAIDGKSGALLIP